LRRTPAFTTATAPVAVIGTIALSLTGSPANAQPSPPADRAPMRGLPAAAAALESLAATAAALAQTSSSPKTHTVVRGDTVSAIAARHGLRTADVLAWNGLGWKSIIHPGDVLRLSASEGSAKMQRAKADSRDASPGASGARGGGTHTVAKGDTLWAIARSEGVGLARLLRANDLTTASIIYPGQKLKIPGRSAATAAATETPRKSGAGSSSGSAAKRVALDDEQVRGVRTIIAVGRDLGVPD
jgi:LysM repeat protein